MYTLINDTHIYFSPTREAYDTLYDWIDYTLISSNLHEVLFVLNSFLESYYILSTLVFITGGSIILFMNIDEHDPQLQAERALRMFNRPPEQRDTKLSTILQRQLFHNIATNNDKTYDDLYLQLGCNMSYELKVRLWHIVYNSERLQQFYRAGSSLGTVYIIRTNKTLISNSLVIREVQFWESRRP